jgi:hypothetical protein
MIVRLLLVIPAVHTCDSDALPATFEIDRDAAADPQPEGHLYV